MVKPEHLGGDRWRVRVYAGRDHLGKPRQRSATFRANGPRAANKLAATHETRLRTDIKEQRSEEGSIKHLVETWRRHRDQMDSPSTIRGGDAMVRRIINRFGRLPATKLTARHLDEWYADMRTEGLKETTIANAHATMRAILRQGEKWEMCTAHATFAATSPTRRYPERTMIQWSAMNALIDSATPDLRMCTRLLAATGMRRGELMALLWSDVDWTASRIRITKAVVRGKDGRPVVRGTKTGRSRIVELDRSTLAVLAEHRRELEARAGVAGCVLAPDGPVVANIAADPTGRTARPVDWLTLAWSRHCARHGAKVKVHDLRHWHASQLLDAGVPALEVSRRLGHSTVTMTLNVYGHLIDGSERRAADLLDERWMLNP